MPPETPEPRPVVSLFEHWEEGAHLSVALNARDYAFPNSLVVPYYWSQVPQALSLQDARQSNDVALAETVVGRDLNE